MAEKQNEPAQPPYVGRLGATVIATVCGGILLVFVSSAFDAPKRADDKSIARHDAQEREIAELRAEAKSIRSVLGTLQQEVGQLGVTVRDGTGDRFTGSEAAGLRLILDEREQRVRSDVEGLTEADQRLWDYSLEERRLRD